ncbi:hypothetical protein [Brevundimonas pishanensis]|uniref:hypothetical protein n=1 Tax=Brevundimonas pishanensis TaxID=2896315 RepID=UPI001FA7A6A7|nr:hypothetical protein [Brevundimonas pishanensis]
MSAPQPEAQWLWRRLFTWIVTAFILLQLHLLIDRMPLEDLRTIAERLILLLASLIALYLIGPSAEHIIALVRAWKDKP